MYTDIDSAESELAMNFELQLRWRQSTTVDEHIRKLQKHAQLTHSTAQSVRSFQHVLSSELPNSKAN